MRQASEDVTLRTRKEYVKVMGWLQYWPQGTWETSIA